MATRIQVRRGTTSEWNTANPILTEGEFGYNTTLDKFKIGDGTSTWSVLEYVPTSADLSSSLGDYIALIEKGGADGVAELDASKNVITALSVVFEGATENEFETRLTVTEPASDITLTLPNTTGTVALTSDLSSYAPLANPTFTGTVNAAALTLSGDLTVNGTTTTVNSTTVNVTNAFVFEGATANAFETTLEVTDPTADRTITLPDATGQVVLRGTTDTLTNKSIALGSNTVTGTVAQFNTALADADFATLAGTETFTNKTLTSPKINEDVVLTATATELNYVDGVTSAIQTQLDGKVDESLFDAKGDLLVASADNTPAKLSLGTNGYILTANSSATNGIEWAAAPISLPSQSGNSGKYLTTDGTTASWGTVSSYSAPTIGSTSIASGSTVTSIAGLTLSNATLSGTLTAGGGTGTAGQVLASTGSGVQWSTPSAGAAFSEFMLIGA